MSAADQQFSASETLLGCQQRLLELDQQVKSLRTDIAAEKDKAEREGDDEGRMFALQAVIVLQQTEIEVLKQRKSVQERITKLTPAAAAALAGGSMSAADQQFSVSETKLGCQQRLLHLDQEVQSFSTRIAAQKQVVEQAGDETSTSAWQALARLHEARHTLLEEVKRLQEQITKLTPQAFAAAAAADSSRAEREEELRWMAEFVELCADLRAPKQAWYCRLFGFFSGGGQDPDKKAQ